MDVPHIVFENYFAESVARETLDWVFQCHFANATKVLR